MKGKSFHMDDGEWSPQPLLALNNPQYCDHKWNGLKIKLY